MKIKVGILGATGSVGQRFVELLSNHPIFEIAELGASDKNYDKKYGDAVNWFQTTPLNSKIAEIKLKKCEPDFESRVIFSALDSSVAGEIEEEFAKKGYCVISNAKNHRMDKFVPLIVPEVNSDHLSLIKKQNYDGGFIVTNPNCSTIGLVLALKPLFDLFGLESVNVVTLQAISGAGYPGVASLDIIDNAIPFISGEEEKIETEPKKIFGKYTEDGIAFCDIKISAQCNRVPVVDGHLECVQVKLKNKADEKDLINAWNNFKALPQDLNLPSAPKNPTLYVKGDKYPQPKLHRLVNHGMTTTVGRLRKCSLMDYKFAILSHNTIRGAAGGTILIAELLKELGYIK